jgi:Asp-tRNA(Asn)/Glu-tRNA(Gln) amidotransferase A subunit family amidase
MPVGLTLTGPRYSDRRLLTVAAAISAFDRPVSSASASM